MSDIEPGVQLAPSTVAAMERLNTPLRDHTMPTAPSPADSLVELEAAQQQPEPIDEAENDRRFHVCMDLIKNATPEQIRAAAGLPERSALVERVADAIGVAVHSAGIVNDRPARATIREVADWLRA